MLKVKFEMGKKVGKAFGFCLHEDAERGDVRGDIFQIIEKVNGFFMRIPYICTSFSNMEKKKKTYIELAEEDIHISLCEPIRQYSKQTVQRFRQLYLFPEEDVETDENDIRVIELFAGVGGFRVGLERASNRFKTVWNNQWEPSTKRQDASIVYQKRFGTEGHSNEDINLVPTEVIPQADLLCGGFPCQDYSVARSLKDARGIEGKKGILWWQIERILRESVNPPRYLMLENVDRIIKSPASQRGRDFAIILASLSDLGYCVEWRVINAADYGMPQRRRRTYMVAYRTGTSLYNGFCNAQDGFKWVLEDGVIAQAFSCVEDTATNRSSFEFEGNLLDISENFSKGCTAKSPFGDAGVMANRKVWSTDVDAVYDGPIMTLGDILLNEDEIPEEFFVKADELPQWEYLKGSKSEMRVASSGFQYKYTEGSMAFPDYLDRPSRTIITGEGGSGPSRFKHIIQTPSGRYRRLVPIELERLNMFPDNHTVGATDTRRAFLMGNALVTGIVENLGRILIARM